MSAATMAPFAIRMARDATVPEQRGVDLQGAGVSDEAVQAALDSAMADSGLPRYGGHRAAVQERYRRAVEAAAPFIRAPLEAEIEELTAECARLGMAGGLMQAERDEARAEVERLRHPTHLCLDCGAVGYAGGYHDHGGGEAGDTASIEAVLTQLTRGGDALDAVDEARDQAIRDVVEALRRLEAHFAERDVAPWAADFVEAEHREGKL